MEPTDSLIYWRRTEIARALLELRSKADFPDEIDAILFGSNMLTPTRSLETIEWYQKSWYIKHFQSTGPFEVYAYYDLLKTQLNKLGEYLITQMKSEAEAQRLLSGMLYLSDKYFKDI